MSKLYIQRSEPQCESIIYSPLGSGMNKSEASLIDRIELIDFLLKNLHTQEVLAILSYFNNLYKNGTKNDNP